MIIYNVTVSVEEDFTNDWLHWMKTEHIPEVMDCGVFIKAQIFWPRYLSGIPITAHSWTSLFLYSAFSISLG